MENVNLKILQETLIERYKANLIVESLQSKIISQVERLVYNKYKEVSIFRDEMEFELVGVDCSLDHYSYSFELQDIRISLHYLCKSKLPKAKREKVEEYRQYYKKGVYIYDNSKKPIYLEFNYRISLEKALSGNFNLDLKE